MAEGTSSPPAKLLKKVEKLIALSASPNKQEARTAAYQACKLIREYELTVGCEAPELPPQQNVWDVARAATYDGSQDDFFVEHRGSDVVFCDARWDSKCAYCGKAIRKGSRIVWYRKEKKVCHQHCADQMNTKRSRTRA